jgi:hypothetical protein
MSERTKECPHCDGLGIDPLDLDLPASEQCRCPECNGAKCVFMTEMDLQEEREEHEYRKWKDRRLGSDNH